MSKAVEGVTEKIEECARKEFKSKGYVEASLRTIAISGNYNWFNIFTIWRKRRSFFSIG